MSLHPIQREGIMRACVAAMASNGKASMTFGWHLAGYLPKSDHGWRYDQTNFVWRENSPGTRIFPPSNDRSTNPSHNRPT